MVARGGRGAGFPPLRGGNVPRRVTTATTWQKDEMGATATPLPPPNKNPTNPRIPAIPGSDNNLTLVLHMY